MNGLLTQYSKTSDFNNFDILKHFRVTLMKSEFSLTNLKLQPTLFPEEIPVAIQKFNTRIFNFKILEVGKEEGRFSDDANLPFLAGDTDVSSDGIQR